MKLKLVHLWIVTTIIYAFINLYVGIILIVATVVILVQDNRIEELEQNAQKSTTPKKAGHNSDYTRTLRSSPNRY